MIPADDEHTSTNEPEDNTSTRGTFFEKMKFSKRRTQADETPARLTHIPACLMKWWTPFVLAILLLIICTPTAFWWGTLPLAVVCRYDTLRNNRGDRLRILGLAAEEPR